MTTITYEHTDKSGRTFFAERDAAKFSDDPWLVSYPEGDFRFHGTKAELQAAINKVSAKLAASDEAED